jgi:hypothetical protein
VTDIFLPVIEALAVYSFTAHDEHKLYEGLSFAFTKAGLSFEREHPLVFPDRTKGRLDYYFPSTQLAVEVKVQGRTEAVMRQVRTYARHESVAAVLLVTSLGKLRLPETLAGKPVRSFRITGAFG